MCYVGCRPFSAFLIASGTQYAPLLHSVHNSFLLEPGQQLDTPTNDPRWLRNGRNFERRSRFIKQLHPLAHAQFASLNSVQRLIPKKGASDKNSRPGHYRGVPMYLNSVGNNCRIYIIFIRLVPKIALKSNLLASNLTTFSSGSMPPAYLPRCYIHVLHVFCRSWPHHLEIACYCPAISKNAAWLSLRLSGGWSDPVGYFNSSYQLSVILPLSHIHVNANQRVKVTC